MALGRVNLITGKNNTGKSSVLEALHIFAHGAELDVISQVLERREGNIRVEGKGALLIGSVSFKFPLCSMVFPEPSDFTEPIVIFHQNNSCPMQLTMQVGWFSEERDTDGNCGWFLCKQTPFDEPDDVAALVIETQNKKKRILALERLERYAYLSRISHLVPRPKYPVSLSALMMTVQRYWPPYGTKFR